MRFTSGSMTAALLLAVMALAATAPRADGLRCYQCGSFAESMSTVNPCFGVSEDDLTECPASHNACKRYSNEGVLVLACSDNCVESHRQNTDITCCDTDACNIGSTLAPPARLLFLAAASLLLPFLRVLLLPAH
ncbi:uncharacterized protein [Penaeus vannamei]|uniref:uncharacterized protein n=1 Tax=Penaeus vannamei TaxID=6689 RepID=UPI00387F5578